MILAVVIITPSLAASSQLTFACLAAHARLPNLRTPACTTTLVLVFLDQQSVSIYAYPLLSYIHQIRHRHVHEIWSALVRMACAAVRLTGGGGARLPTRGAPVLGNNTMLTLQHRIQTITFRIEISVCADLFHLPRLKRNRVPVVPRWNKHQNPWNTPAIRPRILFADLDLAGHLALERTVGTLIDAYRTFTRKSCCTTDAAQQGADEAILFCFAYCA